MRLIGILAVVAAIGIGTLFLVELWSSGPPTTVESTDTGVINASARAEVTRTAPAAPKNLCSKWQGAAPAYGVFAVVTGQAIERSSHRPVPKVTIKLVSSRGIGCAESREDGRFTLYAGAGTYSWRVSDQEKLWRVVGDHGAKSRSVTLGPGEFLLNQTIAIERTALALDDTAEKDLFPKEHFAAP